jgi:hypothetical protein
MLEYNLDLYKKNKTFYASITTVRTRTKTKSTTKIDPCLFRVDKCENNSTCVFDLLQPESYYCICPPGFEGVYCQRDERPCEPLRNKCINNSTCNHYGPGKHYNCSCTLGFEGFHCEFDINDCPEGACENGGQCEDLLNGY